VSIPIPDSPVPDSPVPGSAFPAGFGPDGAVPDSTVPLPDDGSAPVDLGEAARQLEQAIHDARVAFDCIGLEDLDRAHTSAITARTALDSAEGLLRASLHARRIIVPEF
jgi:hypothetical protein